jgi:hypothetical protein
MSEIGRGAGRFFWMCLPTTAGFDGGPCAVLVGGAFCGRIRANR